MIQQDILSQINIKFYCKSDSKAKLYAEENKIKDIIDDNIPIIDVKQKDTKIEVSAREDGVGLALRAYSIDGKNWQESNIFDVKETNTYKVYVRDVLNNNCWNI